MSKRTLGEERVRVDFNPMGTDKIMFLKKEFAQLIDQLERQKSVSKSAESHRTISIAQTKIEEAAMWAVKALTS